MQGDSDPFQYKDGILPVWILHYRYKDKIDGLVQERRNSSALAMELRLSCINPSKWLQHSPIFIMGIQTPGQSLYWNRPQI